MQARISSLFESIQGEGEYVGKRQIFIRFFGCNLNCVFCDTKLKYYKIYTPLQVRKKINKFKIKSVSLTGGEPLCQVEFLKDFLPFLKKDDFKLYLETNGTLYENLKKIIKFIDVISMDLKLESSTGMRKSFWYEHQNFFDIGRKKEIFFKTVITLSTSFNDIKKLAEFLLDKKKILYLQPDTNVLSKNLIKKCLKIQKYLNEKNIEARILPQVHKFLKLR